jgi:hypothetical protein
VGSELGADSASSADRQSACRSSEVTVKSIPNPMSERYTDLPIRTRLLVPERYIVRK